MNIHLYLVVEGGSILDNDIKLFEGKQIRSPWDSEQETCYSVRKTD